MHEDYLIIKKFRRIFKYWIKKDLELIDYLNAVFS